MSCSSGRVAPHLPAHLSCLPCPCALTLRPFGERVWHHLGAQDPQHPIVLPNHGGHPLHLGQPPQGVGLVGPGLVRVPLLGAMGAGAHPAPSVRATRSTSWVGRAYQTLPLSRFSLAFRTRPLSTSWPMTRHLVLSEAEHS